MSHVKQQHIDIHFVPLANMGRISGLPQAHALVDLKFLFKFITLYRIYTGVNIMKNTVVVGKDGRWRNFFIFFSPHPYHIRGRRYRMGMVNRLKLISMLYG